MTAPVFGLLGSGEFEPWAAEVDRALLARATGDGRVLVVPAASAPEGEDVFGGWAAMGLEHYAALGAPAEVLDVRTRDDADAPRFAARVEGASMVFFSGGNPAYLARTLAGTRLWEAVLAGLARGMAYGGCSAGIACLGDSAPDSAAASLDGSWWQEGLRLFPGVAFGPHWDALDRFVPGLTSFIEASVPSATRLLAIDEGTAVVGDGTSWSVLGGARAHLREEGAWRSFASGESFDANLLPAEPAAAAGRAERPERAGRGH